MVFDIFERCEDIEPETVGLLSLFVFVLLTTLVGMQNVISFDQFVRVLTELNFDTGSFGPDTDDEAFQRYRGIFRVESDDGPVIPRLNRLAFIVVVGQIVHTTNRKIAEYSTGISLLGIVVYASLLFRVQAEHYTLAWILSVQFLVLAGYCLIVGGVTVARVWQSTQVMTAERQAETEDDDEEKRPRIRTIDN